MYRVYFVVVFILLLLGEVRYSVPVAYAQITEVPDNNKGRVILCYYADSEKPSYGITDLEALYEPSNDPQTDAEVGISRAFELMTHGFESLDVIEIHDWKQLDKEVSDYYTIDEASGEQIWKLRQLLIDCLAIQGFDSAAPDEEHVIMYVPDLGRGRIAAGDVIPFDVNGVSYRRRVVWTATTNPGTVLHELGHTLGLHHIHDFLGRAYNSVISPLGDSDVVGLTAFELMFTSGYSLTNIAEIPRSLPGEKKEITVQLQQLHPATEGLLPEEVYYGARLPLNPAREAMPNLFEFLVHPQEYLWVEYRCGDERYVDGSLNIDSFSRIRCGIRVYITQDYFPFTDSIANIAWSPKNWSYGTDLGIQPLDPQQPYQVYRKQSGEEDLEVTVCAQYPATEETRVRGVHIGINQMCTVPPKPEPDPEPVRQEVFLPLLIR